MFLVTLQIFTPEFNILPKHYIFSLHLDSQISLLSRGKTSKS